MSLGIVQRELQQLMLNVAALGGITGAYYLLEKLLIDA